MPDKSQEEAMYKPRRPSSLDGAMQQAKPFRRRIRYTYHLSGSGGVKQSCKTNSLGTLTSGKRFSSQHEYRLENDEKGDWTTVCNKLLSPSSKFPYQATYVGYRK